MFFERVSINVEVEHDQQIDCAQDKKLTAEGGGGH